MQRPCAAGRRSRLKPNPDEALDNQCPTQGATLAFMRLHHRLLSSETEDELIASFGAARLVRTLAGRLELRGGTHEEREQARWWMRTFLTSPVGAQMAATKGH